MGNPVEALSRRTGNRKISELRGGRVRGVIQRSVTFNPEGGRIITTAKKKDTGGQVRLTPLPKLG